MVLVDTPVWIDHLRKGDAALSDRLDEGIVLAHSFVIGEVMCGQVKKRKELFALLSALPDAPTAERDEVLALIERRKLFGKGIGWIDAHLLCSALIYQCSIWTRDGALRGCAESLGIDFDP